MNDFRRDDAFQRLVRDEVLAPGFYGKFAVDGRYVFIDKGELATQLQREFAIDTMAQGRDGAAICIEEKIVRWPGYVYSSYTLETESCTKPGREKLGWMHYGRADFLLYCFIQPPVLVWHCIDFPALKAWFLPIAETFPKFGPLATLNASAGRKVPIAAVAANVKVTQGRIHPDISRPEIAALFAQSAAA